MRLSFIFELLLIFVFLAFAASRVIDTKASHEHHKRSLVRKRTKINHKVRQDDTINRYCSCNTKLCNCCRDFDLPVLKGPGCASLQYLNGEKLAISMSFGDRVLTNTTINSRRPRPICMPLPGGVSKFCGRVYNIARQGEDFNACLGLELKALKDVEAALRVSCFRFGPQGLKVLPAQPLPPVEGGNEDDDDDDDYDDDDDFDFDDDDDDDDDEDEDDDNDVESADYESFSLLDDDFIGGLFTSEGDDGEGAPVKKVTTTTKAPLRKVTRKPVRRVTSKPLNTRKVTKKPSVTTANSIVITNKVTEAPTTTVAPTVSIISATVIESEKNPETMMPLTNVSINEIPDTVAENMPIPEHDSIAVVSSMLETPSEESVQHISVPEPVNVSSVPITKIEFAEIVTFPPTETHTDLVTEATVVQASETTVDEKIGATDEAVADEDEDENDEPIQSLIIKDDDDEEEEEEEVEDDSEESDPISAVVEDVLGVEDEKKQKKKVEDNPNKLTDDEKGGKDKESVESKDVVDDIIDGTVDMISLTDDSEEESIKTKTDKEESDEDDDFLDDDDDDEDDDDEDEDDDEARKARTKNFRREMSKEGRKSRDMWLDRLHW